MNPNRWARITGLVLHVLVGGLMILSGGMKLSGNLPEEAMEAMEGTRLPDNITLIGAGELASGLLMSDGTSYVPHAVLLLVTWAAAWMRCPALLASFRAGTPAGEAAARAGTD